MARHTFEPHAQFTSFEFPPNVPAPLNMAAAILGTLATYPRMTSCHVPADDIEELNYLHSLLITHTPLSSTRRMAICLAR